METRKLVEYLGYFITFVAVGCGFQLGILPPAGDGHTNAHTRGLVDRGDTADHSWFEGVVPYQWGLILKPETAHACISLYF